MNRKYYTGVGSRSTPPDICLVMTALATWLQTQGWTLRSGHADGADQAFEAGVLHEEDKDVYLPWRGFNGSPSELSTPSAQALKTVAEYHPRPQSLSSAATKLMARNAHQVLGTDMQKPSVMLVCWTPAGSGTGGTGQAIRIAHANGIPVYDLGDASQLAKIKKVCGLP